MNPRKLGFPICAIFTVFLLPVNIRAQDFQRTYSIPAGGQIRIHNISGDVKVSGYSGNSIVVNGYKKGRDRDKVQIEDTSRGDLLELAVRYPEKNQNFHGAVNFEVRVPQSVQYNFDNIASVSGDIELTDVAGKIKAESVSRDLKIRGITGTVNAHSVSGDVKVEIKQLQGSDDMKFSSISGDIDVMAPANLDADVKMSSVSGSVKSDFPIQIREHRYSSGQSASGKLGAGSRSLLLSSISGDVSLNRRE